MLHHLDNKNSYDFDRPLILIFAHYGTCIHSPPSRQVASILGVGLLWYLRPRIRSICTNLYPTNPEAVNEALCESILRDSLDPGAMNVMVSGSKLPSPRTANELLGAEFGSAGQMRMVMEGMYTGPVLVAQGVLDPLNDARSRAKLLGQLRSGVTVIPIDAGHCPHGKKFIDFFIAQVKVGLTNRHNCAFCKDELPNEVAEIVCDWISKMQKELHYEKSFN